MYKPKDASYSPRYCGIRTFMRLESVETTDEVDFAIIGVPFDTAATNRTGQRNGPNHIRNFSSLLRPYNPDQDINIFDYCSGVDFGDIDVVPGNIHQTYQNIESRLFSVFEQSITPILLGGDHSISLAHLRAAYQKYGKVSLVHFDSHSDTWDEYFGEKYTHGTPFRRAVEEGLIDVEHSIQIGMRGSLYGPEDIENAKKLGFEVITMREVRQMGYGEVIRKIKLRAGGSPVFVSFDVDFVDPAYAPGTGTPEVGGPTSFEALEIVRGLHGLGFVGFDVVEVLPSYDHGELTAMLAASVAYEMITLAAMKKRNEIKDSVTEC